MRSHATELLRATNSHSSHLVIITIVVHSLLVTPAVTAQDTDGDGLLDLIEYPGFDPNATGSVSFEFFGIQDLDGANLLTKAQKLQLSNNQITSIEPGDFVALSDLLELQIAFNQITSIDAGDFAGLRGLVWLDITGNQVTSIDICDFEGIENLTELTLNGNEIASIEPGSFNGLAKLEYLELDRNRIEKLASAGL